MNYYRTFAFRFVNSLRSMYNIRMYNIKLHSHRIKIQIIISPLVCFCGIFDSIERNESMILGNAVHIYKAVYMYMFCICVFVCLFVCVLVLSRVSLLKIGKGRMPFKFLYESLAVSFFHRNFLLQNYHALQSFYRRTDFFLAFPLTFVNSIREQQVKLFVEDGFQVFESVLGSKLWH